MNDYIIHPIQLLVLFHLQLNIIIIIIINIFNVA